MTAKPERQQSHRISLLSGLQHVRSRQRPIERTNHLFTCSSDIHAKNPSLWRIPWIRQKVPADSDRQQRSALRRKRTTKKLMCSGSGRRRERRRFQDDLASPALARPTQPRKPERAAQLWNSNRGRRESLLQLPSWLRHEFDKAAATHSLSDQDGSGDCLPVIAGEPACLDVSVIRVDRRKTHRHSAKWKERDAALCRASPHWRV
jgi:hypothetical protein